MARACSTALYRPTACRTSITNLACSPAVIAPSASVAGAEIGGNMPDASMAAMVALSVISDLLYPCAPVLLGSAGVAFRLSQSEGRGSIVRRARQLQWRVEHRRLASAVCE